ncbi:MAG: hypothetical protein K0Q72_4352, partial [Armatimonadetes bacterium]|nr:hypothetical protein [Armatimonadota bacterium]
MSETTSIPAYLGLDLGGTKVAAGLVTAEGKVLARSQAATADLRATGDPFSAILRLGQELLAAHPVPLRGVGVALPGPADRHEVRQLVAPTIPEIAGLALAPRLRETFGCEAIGDNDANAAALAESRFGAGDGAEDVVYFTVSTGIGGGIVQNGRVMRGASGTSAELGHQVIMPLGGPPCDCGGTGCLEALASGRGIARRGRLALEQSGAARSDLWPHDSGDVTAEVVARAARGGDPLALAVWADTVLYLAVGISNAINIVDPSVVVLGGGVATGAQDLLFEPLREAVRQR